MEEVLDCQPMRLDIQPTEIINISSPLNFNIDDGSHQNDREKWEYEREINFYQKHQPTESEEGYPVSPDMLNDESNIILFEKDVAKPENLEKKIRNSKPRLHFSQRAEPSSPQRRNHSFNKSHNSWRKRSNSSLNRTGDFETKRQEVLRRKEQIERERADRISRKIQEKEEKFKRNQKLKKEEMNISKERRSYSGRRGKKLIILNKLERQNLMRKSIDYSRNTQIKTREKDSKIENLNMEITSNSSILNRNLSSSRLDSQEYDPSPSVIFPSATKNVICPDTPDNYCPIVNAQIKKTWQEWTKTEENISELPLDIEEELRSGKLIEWQQRTSFIKQKSLDMPSKWDRNREESKERLNKSRSKEMLGYKDIHGNQSIIKAFKNSPWNDLLMEYFKNKSALDRKHKDSIVKGHHVKHN